MHQNNYISFPKWGTRYRETYHSWLNHILLSQYGPQRLAPGEATWVVGSDVTELSDFALVTEAQRVFHPL